MAYVAKINGYDIKDAEARADLADEITARQSADTALGGRIDDEITARQSADTALGGRIDDEITARQSADTALGGKIGDLSELTTTATADLVAAINEVDSHADNNATAITNETTARETADGDLTTLTTTDKNSLVGAINEVNAKVTELLTNITWSELKALRDGGNLVKGMQYRITDFVTTTAQADSQSAGHAFDVIVTADSESILNENARAIQHSGDTYFNVAKLKAWDLKYCIDNDTNRFEWADSTNGKGVIYYLKDEHGNACPYDFKNIKFKRYKITAASSGYPNFTGSYFSVDTTKTGYTVDANDYKYFYTFSNGDGTTDISLTGYNKHADEKGSYIQRCECNTIEPFFKGNGTISEELRSLNNIVFEESYWGINKDSNCYNNTFGTNCYSNTFGADCYNNTFGADCYNNTFGTSCSRNTFGVNCSSNILGASCSRNTFGVNCSSNILGANCSNNTFGANCSNNTFGANCYNNTFGANCYKNTFEAGCSSNTFGASCSRNTFGVNCSSNILGASCSDNTFGGYYRWNNFESGCQYCNFSASGSGSAYIQKARIFAGTQGLSAVNKMQVALTAGWVIPYNVKQTGSNTCSITAA